MSAVIVHKGRRNVLPVELGIDISSDVITSQIRIKPDVNSTLIADWEVQVVGDGTEGSLLLILDDLVTSQIAESTGYMDIKRMSGGEPYPVFDQPIEVEFRGTVTE